MMANTFSESGYSVQVLALQHRSGSFVWGSILVISRGSILVSLWVGMHDHLVRTLCDLHGFAINGTALITTLLSLMEIFDHDKAFLLLCLLN